MESEKYQGFLRGNSIDLRPTNKDNMQTYLKWSNDLRNRRLMRNDIPITEQDVTALFFDYEKKENVHFEIWHIADNKLIGDCGLHHIHWRNRNAWISLKIGEPEYWAKGICTEASKLLLKYGFEELNLHKIIAGIHDINLGSQNCALKIGLKFEATLKETVFIDGKYINTNHYTIFDRDWFKLHPREE